MQDDGRRAGRRSKMPEGSFDSHTRVRTPLVLVADDSADLRALYAEHLAAAGLHVETAADGNEAVAIALARMPDVVFMDLDMPFLDGWEATRLLRSYERTRAIPVVAMSGLRDPASVALALRAGCNRFVAKPCPAEDLHRAAIEILGDQKTEQSSG
jgi:two-component system cell cycle response regulator DivK